MTQAIFALIEQNVLHRILKTSKLIMATGFAFQDSEGFLRSFAVRSYGNAKTRDRSAGDVFRHRRGRRGPQYRLSPVH
jgi:hypothetical protein